jgi:hypothetical protein
MSLNPSIQYGLTSAALLAGGMTVGWLVQRLYKAWKKR